MSNASNELNAAAEPAKAHNGPKPTLNGLPTEICGMIGRLVAPPPRIVRPYIDVHGENSIIFKSNAPIQPPLFQVNKVWRNEDLTEFRLHIEGFASSKKIPFNFTQDTLYLEKQSIHRLSAMCFLRLLGAQVARIRYLAVDISLLNEGYDEVCAGVCQLLTHCGNVKVFSLVHGEFHVTHIDRKSHLDKKEELALVPAMHITERLHVTKALVKFMLGDPLRLAPRWNHPFDFLCPRNVKECKSALWQTMVLDKATFPRPEYKPCMIVSPRVAESVREMTGLCEHLVQYKKYPWTDPWSKWEDGTCPVVEDGLVGRHDSAASSV